MAIAVGVTEEDFMDHCTEVGCEVSPRNFIQVLIDEGAPDLLVDAGVYDPVVSEPVAVVEGEDEMVGNVHPAE